jgi:phosphoribosylpyrophosphate synthetase
VVGQVLSLRLAIGLAGASGVTVVLVWMHYSRRDSRREKAGMPPSAHALDVARA